MKVMDWKGIGCLFIGFALIACERASKVPAETEKSGGHREETPTFYAEGKGVELPEETQKAIGLKLAEVTEQEIRDFVSLHAQIYRIATEATRTKGGEQSGRAYALAMLMPEQAAKLKRGQTIEFRPRDDSGKTFVGKLWKLNESSLSAIGKVEALIEIPDAKYELELGEFFEGKIPLNGAARKVVSVPPEGILETAMGKFVFVGNGKHLLRTEVKTGATNGDFVEVTDGLYEGDTIAVQPVESLYLIELRATKGGGHCH